MALSDRVTPASRQSEQIPTIPISLGGHEPTLFGTDDLESTP